jgi:hypothetical protein
MAPRICGSSVDPRIRSPSQQGRLGALRRRRLRHRHGLLNHLVDEAVLERLLGGEPAVAVRIRLDTLDGLAGVQGDPLGHHPLEVDDLLGLDGDVGRLALGLTRGLVHQDAGVGQGEALAPLAGTQEELAHGGRHAHADGGDVAGDELHGVVDGQPGGHRPPGTVDVQADVFVGVLSGQKEQLGADQVGRGVVHLGAQEHDPLLEQALVDVGRRSGGLHLGVDRREVRLGHGAERTPSRGPSGRYHRRGTRAWRKRQTRQV